MGGELVSEALHALQLQTGILRFLVGLLVVVELRVRFVGVALVEGNLAVEGGLVVRRREVRRGACFCGGGVRVHRRQCR